ncbi:hypothetical protein SLS62_006621 [Diatrype stigma]|uniref:Uncharacterized protein n=1 Tax=Diatrype stigma TaxID=117547 RepID=A0AAN9UMU2_9PEZI
MSSRKVLVSLLMAGCASAKSGIYRRQEACTAALLIDDFSQWEEGLNLLEGAAGYDETIEAIGVDDEGILDFEPVSVDTSYVYEQFPCIDATAQGFDGLSFAVRGPAAASVSLELQSKADCGNSSDDSYSSAYYTLDGLSGDLETVAVPLASWTGDDVHLTGLVGVVWFGFSPGSNATDNEWALDTVQLSCAATTTPPEDPEPTSTSSSVPTSSATSTSFSTSSSSSSSKTAAATTTTAEASATQEVF